MQNIMDNTQRIKFIYSWYDQKDWIQIFRNNRLCFVNTNSGQQFTIDRVNIYSQHIIDIYRTRAACPLPNTPKIMLPDRQINKKYVDLWVQRAPHRLDRALHKITSEILILNLLKQLIGIIEIVVRKYGFFRLTPNMIKVNKGNFLQVWINQFQQCCHRQYPLNSKNIFDDYRMMVTDLINIFTQYGQQKNIQYFSQKIQQQKFLSFERSKNIIQTLIKRSTFAIEKRISFEKIKRPQIPSFLKNKVKKSKQNPVSPTSPRKIQFKKIRAKDGSFKHKSQINPPSEEIYAYNPLTPKKKSKEYEKKKIMVSDEIKAQDQVHRSLGKIVSTNGQIQKYHSQEKIPLKNFRQSGLTQPSTNLFYSVHSSGKNNQIQELLSTNVGQKKLFSSFGIKKKDSDQMLKGSEKFKVQTSRIIEQKSEDAPNSPLSDHDLLLKVRQSEIERDIDYLLRSNFFINNNEEQQIEQLQEEMFNLLEG